MFTCCHLLYGFRSHNAREMRKRESRQLPCAPRKQPAAYSIRGNKLRADGQLTKVTRVAGAVEMDKQPQIGKLEETVP